MRQRGISVRGTSSFWIEYGEIPEDRQREVRDIAFTLTEEGHTIDGARHQHWYVWDRWLDGFSVDLPSFDGWIACSDFEDIHGEEFIAMLHIDWFPGVEL